jgi:putative metalloenzyme radical SAM/SPASM domain maturase
MMSENICEHDAGTGVSEVAKVAAGQVHRPYPAKIQVEVTTRCNMNCSMCVKYAPDSMIGESDLSLQDFKKLDEALEHCQGLVLNCIGEPLLNPDLAEMALFARERMPADGWIGFQTNGLLFTKEKAELLVRSGVDTFCVSVDSLDEGATACGELHGQSCVDRLARTFSLIREAGSTSGRKVRLGIEFVLMADTFEQLPAVLEWAAAQGAEFAICSHVMAYASEIQEQSLFNPNTESATEIFEKGKKVAEEKGLDIQDYFDVLWRIKQDDSRDDFIELGQKMRKEAKDADVWFHMKSLLEWDRQPRKDSQKRLERIYDQAEEVAARTGIDMHLPPLKATDRLSCSFIEEGTAFITSDGDVSPCQFLWHGYTCYMDGSEKVVKPLAFGNLADGDFTQIWRSAEYSEFRKEVLEYEYPYCSNCPMVPCDDIIGRSYDFEFDCFGYTVPCGHCPWAMGGLKCLV